LFFILAAIVSLDAQTPLFKYIRESEGLNSNSQWSKNSLHIDHHGFLWIATTKGLNRYDGTSIKSFDGINGGPYDIEYKMISAICGDKKDNIWLGTQEEGIIKYDPRLETFVPFKSAEYIKDSFFGQINNLSSTKDGDVIICTAFKGIFKYYSQKDSLVYLDINHPNNSFTNNSLLVLKNDQLAVLSDNGVFIGNHDNTGSWEYYPIDGRIFLSDAFEHKDGKLEVFAQNRMDHFIIDPLKKEIKNLKNPVGKQTCNFFIGQDNIKWLSTHYGVLARIDNKNESIKTFKAFTDIEGTSLDICPVDVIGDPYGNIYYMSIGTGAGQIITDYPFQFLKGTDRGLIRIFKNEIYVAQGNQLFKYQENQLAPLPLKTDLKEEIVNFEVGLNGNIWIARAEPPSISYFDPNGNQIGPNYPSKWFTQMEDMGNGRLTVGYNFDKNKNIPFNFVGDIYEELSGKEYPEFKSKFHIKTQSGEYWIATGATGVLRIYDNLSKYQFLDNDKQEANSLNSNNPYYIYESKAGLIYVCTDQGINIWNPKTESFSYLNNYDVGFNLAIKGMTEDRDGNLWMVLTNEVIKLDVHTHELYAYKVHPKFKINRYESQDLQIDENGIIYYEGQYGIVKFEPKELEAQRAPNPILFTDLYVNRKRVFPNDANQLIDSSLFYQSSFIAPYKLRDVGFSFVSPHGSDVNAQYFYRLKGYKDEWQSAPSNKTIHFTSLDPGKYSLEVKAKSGGGKWTKEIANIDFKIKAPWYQTWWAYLLYFCSISFLAYTFYRYRINQLLKYQTLRTKISSDLHDDVGSLLGSIAMESEMLSYDKSTSLTAELLRLSELSREAMSRMRDTVWAIDSRKDKVGFLSDRMKDYLNSTLNNSKFDGEFIMNNENSNQNISPDVRQNIYLIFKEALNNALKHSSGDTIKVTFSQIGKNYVLSIHDNGKSQSTTYNSGLGMSNMQMRADLIGAKLEINKDQGFEVKVTF
jgi:ligand-binding sensor domain-containing protein/two-component sensor histidine kinase